ncbi:MAG: RHS repeat protein, partial [Planctomycetales bacterium]|nr:RHS repeat protein [Planctomycetales bacterium]
RTTAIIDPLGGRTEQQFDAAGNLLRVIDPLGNTTSYSYDPLHRITSETNELGDSRTFDYDAVDNLIRQTDRSGRITDFTYDDLNRRTDERWLDAVGATLRSINFVYDPAGQMLSVSDPDATYAFTYDSAGRTTRVTNAGTPDVPVVQRDFAYDAVANLLTSTESIGGSVQANTSYAYDPLHRLTSISQTGAGTTDKRIDFAYDAANRMTSLARFADLTAVQEVATSHYTFDDANRLTALEHQNGTDPLAAYAWTLDAVNRITAAVTPDGNSAFTYDARNQLVSADHDSQDDESYSYDENGNRISGGFTVGDDNRLTSDGTFTYEYDAEGNRVRRSETATGDVTEYTWDHRNRLTAVVTRNSGGVVLQHVEYTYDPFNNRIAKQVDVDGDGPAESEGEHYVYNGSRIALVFDNTGNLQHRYLHGPAIDQILADEDAMGNVLWPLTDQVGSVRDLVDSTGTDVNHLVYDSFGQLTSETNAAVDHLFG